MQLFENIYHIGYLNYINEMKNKNYDKTLPWDNAEQAQNLVISALYNILV
jgi:hypothetical protein